MTAALIIALAAIAALWWIGYTVAVFGRVIIALSDRTHGEAHPETMTEICARAGTHLREVLGEANDLVSHVPGAPGNFTQRRKLRASQA